MSRAPVWLLPLLLVLVLFSGVCALVYQVLWLRLLALTFGVTVHAAATVLASFMGGLALGSLLAGRLADRSARPLQWFGLVEVGIGVCAALSPFALGAVQSAFVAAAPRLPDSIVVSTFIRMVLSFAVLLVPTALMGSTLPLMVRASLAHLEGLGTKASLLYAANTAGAIGGAVLAGFYLIPQIGLSRAFLLAAAINSVVGVVAIVVARLAMAPSASVSDVPERAVLHLDSERGARVALAVTGLSGFASLALEVVWFRTLAIFQGPTTYTFTIVLAVVLTGIALGSAAAAPLLRWRHLDWVQVLAGLQLAGAAVVLQSFGGIVAPESAPAWLERLLASAGTEFAAPAVAMSLAVVLPASIFFGMSFPIALRIWAGADGHAVETGRRVGAFYSVNVGGGILGSLAAGFLLLPAWGSRDSLMAMATLYLIAAVALQLVCARRRPFVTGVMTAGLVAVVLQSTAVPDPLHTASRRLYPGRAVIWQDEGPQTTVAVVGDAESRVLFLNGQHQANDTPRMTFIHRRIGLLPVVLHHRPQRALVVGLGGGASPGGMSQFPGLTVDVVELSEGVIAAAQYFSHINFDILHNPNVNIRVDDGRNYLTRVRGRYDVITADAILPRLAGANSLNSIEYFGLVRGALAPQGIALHWNGGTTEAEFMLILKAFTTVFPDTTLWGDGSLMVGSLEPFTLSRAHLDRMLARPEARRALELMYVESFDDLERMFRAGPADIQAYLGDSAFLSDDRPLLEYFASLPQRERDLSRVARHVGDIIKP